jgi:hypothetical protein
MTAKHHKLTKVNKKLPKSCSENLSCDKCSKVFKSRVGLWKHNKKCGMSNYHGTTGNNCITIDDSNNMDKSTYENDLINTLIKENADFKQIMMKIIENCAPNITNNNTTNMISNNKSFNLNFFLNETCKNAMNITDFVESIKLQLTDLMEVGKLGYVEGISNIIVKNLNNLDETERPIHCTDKKRETFYIKHQGQWEKEDEERMKIRQAIRHVAFKNERLLQKYKEEHPGCNYSESKFSDEYSKLVIEAMGGIGNDKKEKEEKIIKNISKATAINR